MNQHRIRTQRRGVREFHRRHAVAIWTGLIAVVMLMVAATIWILRDAAAPDTTAAGAPIVPVTSAAAPTLSATPEPAPIPAGTIPGEGEFRVGTDIQPGTYTSAGPLDKTETCTWARMRDADSPSDGVVQNRSAKAQTIVTIKTSDTIFYTRNCQTWTRSGS